MAEFIGGNEKNIAAREPIVFENKTECFEVCAGIVFHKSGVYEVSVVGNRTIVSEVPKPKTGHWIILKDEWGDIHEAVCPYCEANGNHKWNYCPNCGERLAEPQESEG